MNYYHITADIDDDDINDDDLQPISNLRSEADGDEPNWLIISSRKEQPLQPPQPPSEPQPPAQETPPVKVRLRPKQKNVSHRISLSQRLSQFWWNHTAGEAVGEASGEAVGEVAGEAAGKAASSCSVDANANAENDQDLPSSTKVNNKDPAEAVAQKITELFGSLQNGNGLEEASEAVQAVKSVEQPPLAQPRRRPRRSNPLRQQRLRHLNTVSGYFNDWTQWMTKTEANALNG